MTGLGAMYELLHEQIRPFKRLFASEWVGSIIRSSNTSRNFDRCLFIHFAGKIDPVIHGQIFDRLINPASFEGPDE